MHSSLRRWLAGQSRGPRYLLPAPLFLLLTTLGSGLLSCGGDTTTGPPPHSATQAYWALQLNQHAVQLALAPQANTVQLTATPVNALGTPLSGFGPVRYTTTDSTVAVSPTGLVTARYITQGGGVTHVIATLQAQNVTLADTVRIQVTDTVPQHLLATFSMQPASGDSAKRSLDYQRAFGKPMIWPATAVNTTGDTVCNATACSLQVSYTSSNPAVATIDSTGAITAIDTGHTVLTATTLAYGVARRDSVVFRVGLQLHYIIFLVFLTTALGVLMVGFEFPPKVLLLGVGATLMFVNTCQQNSTGKVPVGVLFDHPEFVDTASSLDNESTQYQGLVAPPTGSGNIAPFACDTQPTGVCKVVPDTSIVRSRRFPVAGVYHYHSSLFPSATNTIIIQKE